MSERLPDQLPTELDTQCQAIATALASVEDADQAALLAKIVQRIVDHSEQLKHRTNQPGQPEPPKAIPPTPEVLEWARGLFTEEEAAAGLREIRETGGLTFAEVIRGLEPPPAHG